MPPLIPYTVSATRCWNASCPPTTASSPMCSRSRAEVIGRSCSSSAKSRLTRSGVMNRQESLICRPDALAFTPIPQVQKSSVPSASTRRSSIQA
ncbi:hypothetical protein ACFQXA_13560 [Nocardiopsis composta]